MVESLLKPDTGFADSKTKEPLSRVYLCYQCKKCSCGCPIAYTMDLLPHQVMRSVQLGLEDKVLNSNTMWICASCEACTTRCPNDIDIAAVMDELRHIATSKRRVSQKNIERFHKVFLAEVKRMGRLHELSMIGRYKILSGEWFKDTVMGMRMFLKGKLKILPGWIRGRREIKRLFRDSEEE